MFYIVESQDYLDRLCNPDNRRGYLQVITNNENYHPSLQSVVGVYLRPLNHRHGYIIPISHPDGLSISKDRVLKILNCYDELFVLNKKDTLYHFLLKNLTDLQLLVEHSLNRKIEITTDIKVNNLFKSKYRFNSSCNKIIPLTKHFEENELIFDKLKEYFDLPKPNSFNIFNNIGINVFYLIEQNGIGIDEDRFIDVFNVENPSLNINTNTIFSSYNLYNTTSRPTNSFNSINFTSIPKKPEYRECFRPKNDYFIEFDFDSFHLRLLGELVGYDFGNEKSIHRYLGKQYYQKEEITEEEYKEIKQKNFQSIYGGIPEDLLKIEFYQKINEYITNLWEEYRTNGLIYSPLSEKVFSTKIDNLNKNKVFNYTIQNFETTKNILILKEVLRYLKDKKSFISLYIYDSIILDYSEEEGLELIEGIKQILNQNNKYPVHTKKSKSLVF